MLKNRLLKNKLPYLLMTAIDAGGEKNVAEWAEEFNCSISQVTTALSRLRKMGYLYHPIGSSIKGRGIVTNVMNRQEDLVETMERQRSNYLDPQLVAFSRFVEQGIKRFPKLIPVFRTFLNSEMAHLTIVEEELKLPHGNSKHSN